MKRKIKLEIKDYRDSFDEPHKKKPYFLYVQSGGHSFYFSNKKKAQRWLSKFTTEATELYREIGSYLIRLYELNILCVDFISLVNFQKKRQEIELYTERYWRVLRGFTMGQSVQIGRELNIMYKVIYEQLNFYRSLLRKNNRCQIKFETIRYELKQLKRLRVDFDLLLSDVDGMKKVTKIEEPKKLSELVLNVA